MELKGPSERGRSQRNDSRRCSQIVVTDSPPIATDQVQVLEKGEGTDELENLREWKEERSHAEGLEGRGEFMERD